MLLLPILLYRKLEAMSIKKKKYYEFAMVQLKAEWGYYCMWPVLLQSWSTYFELDCEKVQNINTLKWQLKYVVTIPGMYNTGVGDISAV